MVLLRMQFSYFYLLIECWKSGKDIMDMPHETAYASKTACAVAVYLFVCHFLGWPIDDLEKGFL